MLHYLNGIESEDSLSGRRSGNRAAAKAKRISKQVEKRAKKELNKRPLLKKAFSLLPPVAAVNLIKRKIAANKNKPFAATQLTQFRALKNEQAKRRKNLFKRKGDPILLDEETINQAPVLQDEIENDQLQMEVENEIETEQELEEQAADLGIYYPMNYLSGKADRKQRREEKAKSKVEKRNAKAQLKRDKGEAKKTRAARPRKSGKEIFSDVLDSTKQGLETYKQFKGQGSEEESMQTDQAAERTAAPTFFEKNKMLIIGGGLAAAVGIYFVTKKK